MKKKLCYKKPVLIGLTGGPGVGKTEVAKIISKKNAVVISADKIGHELLKDNERIERRVIKLLGDHILDDRKNLDRKKIGGIVFADEEMMASYNAIIHPELLKCLKNELDKSSKYSRKLMVVVDAALIFEWQIANWFDFILAVTAKRELRLNRIRRNGFSLSRAKKRVASQLPQRLKIGLADYVIENNSNRSILTRNIDKFIEAIKRLLEN